MSDIVMARQPGRPYSALADADSLAESTHLTEVMLQALHDSMTDALSTASEKTSEEIVVALQKNGATNIAE